jgi:hypothetical protein
MSLIEFPLLDQTSSNSVALHSQLVHSLAHELAASPEAENQTVPGLFRRLRQRAKTARAFKPCG